MSEYGIVTEAGAVRFERLLPGPIERVWAYLTEPEKRGTWLAAGPMELRVGGRVELNFHHASQARTPCAIGSALWRDPAAPAARPTPGRTPGTYS